MKTDLDSLMQAKNIDVLLATGPAQYNPAVVYLTGGGHLTGADVIKVRGEAPVLFHASMERDEAARTGLSTISYQKYPQPDLLKEANGDRILARALRYKRMLSDLGISTGRMLVYGRGEVGTALGVFNRLQEVLPGLSILSESDDSLLLKAMATKDETEVERIRQMGKNTVEVVGLVVDYLSSQAAHEGVLVDAGGVPITIGQVKRRINLWLAERGADNPEGAIFAIGSDAGVPHSSGNPSDLLRLGETIVFDIFPCEAGGGYYYDFTRTWCLGHAPDEALALYEDVLAVFQQIQTEFELGKPCAHYQKRTCELFEARGHPTLLSNPATEQGYVHSLAHGLGLHVHERPWFGSNASPDDIIEPGIVFTVEPGLYYPERSLGVRLEDSVWVQPDGTVETLVNFPLDLVIPVKA